MVSVTTRAFATFSCLVHYCSGGNGCVGGNCKVENEDANTLLQIRGNGKSNMNAYDYDAGWYSAGWYSNDYDSNDYDYDMGWYSNDYDQASPPEPEMAIPSRCNRSAEKITISMDNLGTNDLENTNITYNDVAEDVKLVITTDDNYERNTASVNGANEQGFGTINVKSGTRANLIFRFLDASNQPVMMEKFYFSFYDVDAYKDKTIESYKICANDASLYAREEHEMEITSPSDGCYIVRAAAGAVDEPESPAALTNTQKQTSFTMAFSQSHGFNVTFEVETSTGKGGGRNFLFSGHSAMCD